MPRDLNNPVGFVLSAVFPTLCGEAPKRHPTIGYPMPPGSCLSCGAHGEVFDPQGNGGEGRWEKCPDCRGTGAAPRNERKGTPTPESMIHPKEN